MEIKLWCYMIVFLFTVTSGSSLLGGRDDIFHLKFSTGRTILQVVQECPVNIETLNYTNLRSQCKPKYEKQPCCTALKELVCPYVEQFEARNNCADRLFKYFDFLQYPDGLFRDICTETKNGLPCPETPSKTSPDASADQRSSNPSHELMILTPTLIVLLLIF